MQKIAIGQKNKKKQTKKKKQIHKNISGNMIHKN